MESLAEKAKKEIAEQCVCRDTKEVVKKLDPTAIPDPSVQTELKSQLEARGRVEALVYKDPCPIPRVICNSFGKIDGAHLRDYDPERRIVTIRVDHSETPSFWMQIELPLNQLEEWIGQRMAADEERDDRMV